MAVSLEGLHPTLMRPRVEAVLADPEARGMGLFVISAFRSVERQRQLFAAAVRKYGSEQAARRWVAPPGKSNHGPKVAGYGTAVDFGVPGLAAVSGQWPKAIEEKVNRICARHGLYSPMEWEDWHFEPVPNWHPPMHPQPHLEDTVFEYKVVTIPAPNNDGVQKVDHDVNGNLLGRFFNDVTVTIKANNDSRPVKATVQPWGYDTALVLTFIGTDVDPETGKPRPVPEGNVGIILSHPPR